jgi:hypothetical protein
MLAELWRPKELLPSSLFLHEGEIRIQVSKRCSFVIQTTDKVQKNSFTCYNAASSETLNPLLYAKLYCLKLLRKLHEENKLSRQTLYIIVERNKNVILTLFTLR